MRQTSIGLVLSAVVLASSAGFAQAACTQNDLFGRWNAYGLMAGMGADTAGTCVLGFDTAGLLDTTVTRCTGRNASAGGSVTIRPTGSLVQLSPGSCNFRGNINTKVDGKTAIVNATVTPSKTQFFITGNIPADPANFATGGGFSMTAVRP